MIINFSVVSVVPVVSVVFAVFAVPVVSALTLTAKFTFQFFFYCFAIIFDYRAFFPRKNVSLPIDYAKVYSYSYAYTRLVGYSLS